MLKRIASLLLVLAVSSCGPEEVPTGSLSPDQRREVQALITETIKTNPELVQAALTELETRASQALQIEMASDRRDFAVGPTDASVTIVEFFDYRCPYCHSAYEWSMEAIRRNPKSVRFVFKEFPVLGPESVEAARAALAAKKQGKYLELHRALMEWKGPLGPAQIDEAARRAGLDLARLRRDMEDRGLVDHLRANIEQAQRAEVNGTPAFMINGRWVHGWNAEQADQLLKDALKAT
jgi:protein-disulfide isomerase